MNNKHQTGITLLELVIVLSIIAFLISLAVPSMRELRLNTLTTGHSNDLLTALSLARGEAVKLNRTVTITATTPGDWSAGWRLTQDVAGDGTPDDVLQLADGFQNFTTTAVNWSGTSINSFAFTGLGRLAAANSNGVSFAVNRDGGMATDGRMVCVAPSGQVEVRKGVVALC